MKGSTAELVVDPDQQVPQAEWPMDFDAALHLAQGDVLAWLIKQTAQPDVAEDILQTSLLKAHQSGNKPDVTKVRPWLFVIAQNSPADHYRKKQPLSLGEDLEQHLAPQATFSQPLDALMQQELAEWLNEAEADLSPKLATCFRLRMREQLSFKEMAQRLGELADRLMGRTYLASKNYDKAYHRRFSHDD